MAQHGLAQTRSPFGCIWDARYNDISPELSSTPGPPRKPKYLGKGRAAPRAQSGVAPPSMGGQETSGVKARGPAQTKHNRRGEPDSVGAFYFRAADGRVVDFSFPHSTQLSTTAQPSGSGRRRTVVWALAVPRSPRDTAFPWGAAAAGRCGQHTRETERGSYILTDQPGETEHRRSWAKERRSSEGEKERR